MISDTPQNQESIDAAILQQFQYKQELARKINFFGSFAVAFSAISITTGIFLNYGFALKNCGPVAIWIWPLVALGQTLVAAIFAELAGRIPITGYSYQWVSRLTGPALGWFCGWTAAFNFTVAVSAINMGLSPIVAQVAGIELSKAHLLLITLLVVSVQAFINIRGVKLATHINNAAVYTEMIGMFGIIVLIIAGGLFLHRGIQWNLLFASAPQLGRVSIKSLVLGSLLACWAFIGFEFAAGLSEETTGATKVVPVSVILSMVVSALVGMLFLIVVTLAIPNLLTVTNSENPIPVVLESVLGHGVSLFFLWIVMASMFACAFVCITMASRIIYSMARDGVFFFSGFFKKVSTNQVPQRAVLLVFALNIVIARFADSLTNLVAATSVLPAVIYLITVGSYAFNKRKLAPVQTFNLGKWSGFLSFVAIAWLILEIGILTIPKEFHGGAKLALLVLGVGIAVYFLFVRKTIAQGRAGIRRGEARSKN